jgi:hypothetical protein
MNHFCIFGNFQVRLHLHSPVVYNSVTSFDGMDPVITPVL